MKRNMQPNSNDTTSRVIFASFVRCLNFDILNILWGYNTLSRETSQNILPSSQKGSYSGIVFILLKKLCQTVQIPEISLLKGYFVMIKYNTYYHASNMISCCIIHHVNVSKSHKKLTLSKVITDRYEYIIQM